MILLSTIIAFHLVITLLFSIAIGSWKSKKSLARPAISIIIAARNEEEHLKKLIPKLLNQYYPQFEIIIGLDRCTDQSKMVLESFQGSNIKWIDIKSVPKEWNSKKYALSKAITLSNGEWLVFTDADCLPNSEHWLDSMAQEIDNNSNVVIGISPYKTGKDLLSKFIQFEAFMTYLMYSGFTLLKRPYMAVGRNLAIRKSYFHQVGGYESIKHIRGGDDDLFIQKSNRIGISLRFGKDSLTYTNPSRSWSSYKKQKLRHLAIGKHYAGLDMFLLSVYHLIHLAVYLLPMANFKSTFLLPVILFYLFIKFVSYRFVAGKIGAGFNYILLPIVDMLYAFMIPVIGIWSKFIKDIEWKN